MRRSVLPASVNRSDGSLQSWSKLGVSSEIDLFESGSLGLETDTSTRLVTAGFFDCVPRIGTGSSPRRSRSRTSAAVAGAIPASRATCRSEMPGLLATSSAARARPAEASTGLDRPSRPILLVG